ncbi:MAG TPA: dihydrofolate reductase family protein [Actinomycetota bacterium]|nr:dihydrofolate reductase family protein [Actinomycetota bacterium]
MPKLRVHNFSVSLDGFAAGPRQSLENPLGKGGEELHGWMFRTAHWHEMVHLEEPGEEGVDNDFAVAGDDNIGAHIMGRNMFGPIRGDWGNDDWRGWWGEDPPYHHDVFVLTHYPHDDIPMQGGTTFHFVTDGIESALERAFAAADGRDVRVGGGASTVRQYLAAGAIDHLHFVISPILLGTGERLFEDNAGALDGYECSQFVGSEGVAHAVLTKR